MIVNDALSTILTAQSWAIANNIVMVLNYTNILVLMFAIVIFQTWTEVAQEGEDEGNKGLLGLNRSEVRLIVAGAVCLFAVLPVFPLNVNTLILNQNASNECGVGVSSGHTQGQSTIVNDKQVMVPIWWALWHGLTQGITNASVASIPCHYDIQRSLVQLSQAKITSQPLRQEIQDFYEQCYTRAFINMKAGGRKGHVTEADYQNATWIGDTYFLGSNWKEPRSTYQGLQAEKIVFNFPYDPKRDDPIQQRYRSGMIDKTAAYPMCDEWWSSNQNNAEGKQAGLRWRIAAHIRDHHPKLANSIYNKGTLFEQLMPHTSQLDRIDMLIQRVLSVENISTDGRIVRGYSYVLDKNWDHQIGEVWGSSAGWAGLKVGHILSGPALFVVREAMPMIQAILMACVVIASPIILVISAYSMSTLMSLSLTYAGLNFLTFWWELCRSLDSKLITTIYQTHSNLNLITGTINAMDDSILKFVLVLLYIIVPVMWFGLLGFAGYKVNSLGMESSIDRIQKTTQDGSKTVVGAATKQLKGS